MGINTALSMCKDATWFMVIVDGRHDLYINNERDTIASNYSDRNVKRVAGFGCNYSCAQSVKIEIE